MRLEGIRVAFYEILLDFQLEQGKKISSAGESQQRDGSRWNKLSNQSHIFAF